MNAYRTVVVGTDGSPSSLRAVDRAAEIAGDTDATLIIVTGYRPPDTDLHAVDALGDEAYQVTGGAPIYATLRDVAERARRAGAKNVEERAIAGAPVSALVDVAEQVGADLLVVGNVGLNARSALIGRVFSVPGGVASRAGVDILIVHTTG